MPATEKVLPPIQEQGFKGMNANLDQPVPVGFVSLAQNFFLEDGAWKPRPGIKLSGSAISANTVQCIAHFNELDGTAHTVCIVNDGLYSYTWGTDTWALTQDLSAAGITVSASALIDVTISRGRAIFADGVNDPFMWDPSGPTFTQLTAAAVTEQVEVYYDKVFGHAGLTFEWSDEGDPTAGYAGANQAWDFAQRDGGPLTALTPLNEHMVVFKEDSIASVRGAVEDTFQTDAVREGISETEGSPGFRNIQVVDGDVYYTSVRGPRVLVSGIKRVVLDEDELGNNILGPQWLAFERSEIQNSISFYDAERGLIVWLMALAGETSKYTGLMYSTQNGSFSVVQFASGFNFESAAAVEDPDGNEFVMLGDDSGQIYIWGDVLQAASDDGEAFTFRLRSRQYGQSLGVVQKRIAQVDLVLEILSAPFRGLMRPYLDGDPDGATKLKLTEKFFGYETLGKKRKVRGMNFVGWTVGWDLEIVSTQGQAEVHSALTQMTTTGRHGSRG